MTPLKIVLYWYLCSIKNYVITLDTMKLAHIFFYCSHRMLV